MGRSRNIQARESKFGVIQSQLGRNHCKLSAMVGEHFENDRRVKQLKTTLN